MVMDDKCIICGEEARIIPTEYYMSEHRWLFVCNDCIKKKEKTGGDADG